MADTERAARTRTVRIEGVVPILRVHNLEASIEYYVRALGFAVDWLESGVMASVSRDRASLMLCEGDQGYPGTWVWIGVDDAAALFDELAAADAAVRLPPTNYPWALEIHVQDPDGHVLRFGSEPRVDQTFSAWVDWYRKRDGDVAELNALFRDAVSAIDAGELTTLEHHLSAHPELVRERLAIPGDWLRTLVDGALEGYFHQPYLLWFIANNPIRCESLPGNIAAMARAIVRAAERQSVGSLRAQIDYTLGLVCSGRVPRESGVQGELIDLLCDAGADGNAALLPALAHKELAAVERLIARGAALTLVAAVCTGRHAEAGHLASTGGVGDRQLALSAAALYGQPQSLAMLIDLGVDVSAYSPAGFHPHATALHHAVDSGSLEAVQVLVDAGAPLDTRDRIHEGTPLDWAEYLGRPTIASYLRDRGPHP